MRDNNLARSILAFVTDSIEVTQKIEGFDSKSLEEMKPDKQDEGVIFLSNGFYRFNSK